MYNTMWGGIIFKSLLYTISLQAIVHTTADVLGFDKCFSYKHISQQKYVTWCVQLPNCSNGELMPIPHSYNIPDHYKQTSSLHSMS